MSIIDSVKSVFVPINREGHPFIAIIAVATLVLFGLSDVLGSIGLILTVWCIYFFRDPVRSVPSREGLIISPADGVVQKIDAVAPPAELEMGGEALTRVCIFMNVFDVHVNRSPIAGTVSALHYYPGTFVSAADKESDQNERQALRITTADTKHFAVVQIAGLIARRIICNVKVGDALATGERFGMIRFGSRVDVYLPAGVSPLVVVGQRMVAGETIVADLKSDETARTSTRI